MAQIITSTTIIDTADKGGSIRWEIAKIVDSAPSKEEADRQLDKFARVIAYNDGDAAALEAEGVMEEAVQARWGTS